MVYLKWNIVVYSFLVEAELVVVSQIKESADCAERVDQWLYYQVLLGTTVPLEIYTNDSTVCLTHYMLVSVMDIIIEF